MFLLDIEGGRVIGKVEMWSNWKSYKSQIS